ncbi:hypothetical protein JB92DRAFT_493659 [Gautieria morchelliformis]|nr:hypothetical protein JB92DRAFT_493659 [Gautieria morchelliformis]
MRAQSYWSGTHGQSTRGHSSCITVHKGAGAHKDMSNTGHGLLHGSQAALSAMVGIDRAACCFRHLADLAESDGYPAVAMSLDILHQQRDVESRNCICGDNWRGVSSDCPVHRLSLLGAITAGTLHKPGRVPT